MADSGRDLRRKRLLNAGLAMLIVGLATAVFSAFSDTDSLNVAMMTNIVLGLALILWYNVGPGSSPSPDRDNDQLPSDPSGK